VTDELILFTLDRVDNHIASYKQLTDSSVTALKEAVREDCARFREEISLRVSVLETELIRVTVVLTHDVDYHLLRAYYHASPSLTGMILAIVGFIKIVIGIINTINTLLKVITSETLAYWLDKLMPGFQDRWNDIMNKISQFSSALGWGVDGVNHLVNSFSAGADLWSMVTGKDRSAAQMEKIRQIKSLTQGYQLSLKSWQDNPGSEIAALSDTWSKMRYDAGAGFINNLTDKLTGATDRIELIAGGVGTITSELLAIRNDMPAFIAKNIPQALWDAVGWADTMINDRLLPRLDELSDKLDEVDAVLEAHRAKAEALADKIAHPGDLLAEIDKLPLYARTDQLIKIDSVTSAMLRESNEAEFATAEGNLREFSIIAEALSHAPPAPGFMLLELPGRSPGIVEEPRETWFVGDY